MIVKLASMYESMNYVILMIVMKCMGNAYFVHDDSDCNESIKGSNEM